MHHHYQMLNTNTHTDERYSFVLIRFGYDKFAFFRMMMINVQCVCLVLVFIRNYTRTNPTKYKFWFLSNGIIIIIFVCLVVNRHFFIAKNLKLNWNNEKRKRANHNHNQYVDHAGGSFTSEKENDNIKISILFVYVAHFEHEPATYATIPQSRSDKFNNLIFGKAKKMENFSNISPLPVDVWASWTLSCLGSYRPNSFLAQFSIRLMKTWMWIPLFRCLFGFDYVQ